MLAYDYPLLGLFWTTHLARSSMVTPTVHEVFVGAGFTPAQLGGLSIVVQSQETVDRDYERSWFSRPGSSRRTAALLGLRRGSTEHRRRVVVSRYDTRHVDIYRSARKHGVPDADILHAVDHALGAAEQDDGKVLYLGADRAGNMLEVIAIERDDGTEIVIHAMRMRRLYEPLLREMRGTND
jgi:hypothetical protein